MPSYHTGRAPGRPPLPSEIKRKRGRKLPPPSVVLTAPETPPEPPEDLREPGASYWRTIISMCPWLTPDIDYPILHMSCQLMDEIAQMRALLNEKGIAKEEPIGTSAGKVIGKRLVPSGLLKELRIAEVALRTHLSELGLTPTARARLGYAEVRCANQIEELMQRREDRRRGRE